MTIRRLSILAVAGLLIFPVPGAAQESPAPWTVRLEALQKLYRPGQPCPLRFILENTGAQPTDLKVPADYLEGLEITDPTGRVIKTYGKTRESKRSMTLEGNALYGRTVDVSEALRVEPGQDGRMQIRWKHFDAESAPIEIAVYHDYLATIETTQGDITIELFPEDAPRHVENFLSLARKGFYDGTLFHRVIAGFMMQGGAPKDGSEPGFTLKAEFGTRKHVAGIVSMARTPDPDSASTQFFICFAESSFLDGQYTVFGNVVEGMETVHAVEQVKTDHSPCAGCKEALPARPTPHCGAHHADRPVEDVVIKRITIRLRGEPKTVEEPKKSLEEGIK